MSVPHSNYWNTFVCLDFLSLEFTYMVTGLSKGKWLHSVFKREGNKVGLPGILGRGAIQVQLLRVLLTDRGNWNIAWVIRNTNAEQLAFPNKTFPQPPGNPRLRLSHLLLLAHCIPWRWQVSMLDHGKIKGMCSHLLFSCWSSATYMILNKVFYCFSHTGFAVGAQVLWKPLPTQSQNGRVKDISIIVGRVDLGKSSITGHLVYEWGSIIKQAMESFTRRLLKWEQVPSGMPTSWTNLNVSMGVVLHAQLPVEIYNEQMLCDYPWCSRTQIFIKKLHYRTISVWLAILNVAAGPDGFEAAVSKKMGSPVSIPFWLRGWVGNS